jgi:hypothetical protein
MFLLHIAYCQKFLSTFGLLELETDHFSLFCFLKFYIGQGRLVARAQAKAE